MSDDFTDRPDNGDGEPQVDPAIRRRQQAQGAAGDLARMGIDPRSLGLGAGEPPSARESAPIDDGDGRGGEVVPLRPQFGALQPQGHVAPPVPQPEPVAPAAPAPVAPVAPGPAARPDTSRLLRQAVKGFTTPDAALAMQDERAVIDAVRQRQSDRRVVAFIAGKGGVGCTTAAAAVGVTFMAMRDDKSVLVDVQQGTASLGEALGVGAPVNVAGLIAETEAVDPPATAAGLGVVDGAGWDQGLTRNDLSGVLERLGGEHTFNLLDVGDDAGEGGHAGLARADQVVVVTGPGRQGAAALASATDRVREVNPMALERMVTVVVCPHEDAHKETLRELGGSNGRLVVVPPDESLRLGQAFDPGRVGGATREAFLRVAAGIAAR